MTYTTHLIDTFTPYNPTPPDYTKGYGKDANGVDFYAFISDATKFTPNKLKILVGVPSLSGGTLGPISAAFDASALIFPVGTYYSTIYLAEVDDYIGYDPISDVNSARYVYDPATGNLNPSSNPTVITPAVHQLGTAFKRATTYEAAIIETILSTLTPQERRIVELSSLKTSDALFLKLADLFVTAFGRGRAQVLLAQN